LAGLDNAIRELASGSDPGRGRVDVACIASISVGILPSVVRAFRAAHPTAIVRVRDDDPDGIIRRVRSGGVDLAVSLLFEPDQGYPLCP
jgi:DNA-binding transcriptional LysR family regulator